MCIRDSFFSHAVFLSQKFDDILYGYFLAHDNIINTVSYTHLDVYKRQIYNSIAATGTHPIVLVATHMNPSQNKDWLPFKLDVYKRQVLRLR